MAKSGLGAVALMTLALTGSYADVGAQQYAQQPNSSNDPVPMNAPPVVDQERMACEASLQAYDERGCDQNCSDECRRIGSDLSGCKNIGGRSLVACHE